MSLNKLKEGEDYIIKNGNVVFTSYFHIKRGFCCGNGCKNCPYINTIKGERKLKDKFNN